MNNTPVFKIASLLLSIFIVFTAFSTKAQNNEEKTHNEQVVIIGSTDPTVNQSRKINLTPEEPVQPTIKKDFTFTPINKYFYTPSKFSPIKPASFSSYVMQDIYNNVVKAGFGTRISPYVEFFHSQAHKGKFKFDFHALHHSSFGKVSGYTPSPTSNSLVETGYTQYLKNHTVEFKTGYRYRTHQNYVGITSYNQDDYDMFKLAYNLLFFDANITSNYKNNRKLHHDIKTGGYYFFNKRQQNFYTQSNELNLYTLFDFHKAYRVSDVLDFQHLGGSGKIEYYKTNNTIYPAGNGTDTANITDIMASITPYFKARYGILSFKAGLKISYLSSNKNGHFRIFPDILARVNLLPEYLELYAGAGGKYKKNSYKLLAEENPFITPNIPTNWKVDKLKFYGGFRGNVAKTLGFNMELSWTTFKNDYFYVSLFDKNQPQTHYLNNFIVINDDGNLLNFNGQLTYSISPKVNFYMAYQYNNYNLESLAKPTGKLLQQLRTGGSYLIKERFKPWFEVIYVGKREALSISSGFSAVDNIELNSFIDLNLGMDYFHTENISAFIKITNLLNNKYEYFYNHPTYGIEIMLGAGYKF